MQTLVLAGGEGTRLRPLTLTVPKPVMPLAGRPLLSFMLDWAAEHGASGAVLSCGFMADGVERVLGRRHGEMPLTYVAEDTPLGTAGPVRLAADRGEVEGRLLVLNGDVLADLDLSALVARHEESGSPATIALIAVEDPTSYGVVPTAPDGRVEAFLEKQAGPPPTNRINAGAYLLEPEVIDRIPSGRPVSFEREVFPALVERGELMGHQAEGYWIDIGTPERYLEATFDLLSGAVHSTLPPRDATGSLVHGTARVAPDAVGPLSVVGAGSVVAGKAGVRRSVLHERVEVAAHASVENAVLADGVWVGTGASVAAGAVVGAGARIGAGASIAPDARVAPGARVDPGERVETGAVASPS